MKIVLISDPHVRARGQKVRGIESAARLDACVRRVNELAGDADLCVLMGDNVDPPSEEAYHTLLECLRPLHMPVRFLIGNHDDRDLLLGIRPDLPRDENGFLQSALATEDALLLFLDTNRAGTESGDYGPERLAWLKHRLSAAGQRPVYIFMHHPPFKTGFFVDNMMLEQPAAFLEAVSAAGNVRHIFLGHTHRAASGSWNGVAWTTLHGTAYQSDFELLPGKPNYRSGPAQIGILLIGGGESVVHFQDILDPYPLIAYSGRSRRAPGPGAGDASRPPAAAAVSPPDADPIALVRATPPIIDSVAAELQQTLSRLSAEPALAHAFQQHRFAGTEADRAAGAGAR